MKLEGMCIIKAAEAEKQRHTAMTHNPGKVLELEALP